MRQGTIPRRAALAVLLAGGLLLAACSNGTAGASGGGGPSSGPASGGGSSSAVGTDSVSGVGTVLDTAKGLTLYYNTREQGGKIVCTGSCAQTWPPFPAPGGAPALPAGVQGSFGTVTRPDGGRQLTFDGFPLYTYAGDTGPGQATGQGIQGIWFAAPASGPKQGGSSGGSGGYTRGGNGY